MRSHEPAQQPWPVGFREFLDREFDGYSPLVSRALADNCAALFHDGPYAHKDSVWSKIRKVGKEFLWPG